MNHANEADAWTVKKFAVGQPVRRTEDQALVRGQGRYTDDVNLPRQAYAVMVRSRHGHGILRAIETPAARAMPGVLGIYTAADLTRYGTLKCVITFPNRDGTEMKKPSRPILTTNNVRFVGDPEELVVAETLWQAKAPADAITVEI